MCIKKKKWKQLTVIMLLTFICMSGKNAQAAEVRDMITESETDQHLPEDAAPGRWKIDKKGKRYVYTDHTYPRNTWLRINGSYYLFNRDGYVRTGKVKYKGATYYFSTRSKNKGKLLTGRHKIGGKTYYFSPETARMVTGWTKIGKYKYYFSPKTGALVTNKWVGKHYVLANGKMAVNRWVGRHYLDGKGNIVTGKKRPKKSKNKKARLIILGDCRTESMQSLGIGDAIYIGRVSMGYNWLASTAGPKLESYLAMYPESTVVFNFGLNDYLYQKSRYLQYYKNFIAKHPNLDMYIMSINPVIGVGAYNVCNATIKPFNDAMKNAFPEQYLDCYSYLMKAGYYASDGQHYDARTYRKIYNYIVKTVGW